MAAPNIVNVSTITAKTVAAGLTTSVSTDILVNAASSGKVFKINTILISNIDGTNSSDVTVYYNDGSVNNYAIASTISVPADSTLVLTDKNSVLYLEEDTRIRAGSSTASDLMILISYEEIS
jgi:hypothetical protein